MKSKELMDLYSDFLLSSPQIASCLTLSKILNQEYSHDSFTRMLAQPELDQKTFWKIIKTSIRRIEDHDGVISFDDTIQHKPHSDENDLICWHFDHSKNRSVKGINMVTFTYVPNIVENPIKMPLAFDLVRKDLLVEQTKKVDDKFVTTKVRKASISKLDLVQSRLKVLTYQNHVQYKYTVFDTWYSSSDLIKFIVQDLKKEFVCAIKDNRLISLELNQDNKSQQWVQVSQADIEPDRVYQVYVKGIPFVMCLIKKVHKNLDGSIGVQYLLTSDTDLDAEKIEHIYKKRWSSEDAHRSLKQNTALEKMPAKKESSQANHIFSSFVALAKLECLKIATKLNHYALKRQVLIQALKNAWDQIKDLKEIALKQNIILPNFLDA